MPIQQTPAVGPALPKVDGSPSPAALFDALTGQKSVLMGQMSELQEQRSSLTDQLAGTGNDVARKGLEDRITAIDKRLAGIDDQVGTVDLQIAKAASVPGAVVPHEGENAYHGPPDAVFALAGMFIVVVFGPLSIAFARRIWKRSATVVSSIPSELMARIQRIEHAVETSGLEIERIGEGQRFITKLFSEKMPALPAGGERPRNSES